MKTKTIPFDLETAKKIQAGEIEGRIVTNHGVVITLLDAEYRFGGEYNIPVIWHWETGHNELVLYNNKGECKNSHRDCYLHIELPEEVYKSLIYNPSPKHEFKPFDRVLVKRNGSNYGNTLGTWTPAIFQKYVTDYGIQMYYASGLQWHECIPYEGNEHLVGTTGKPKEE